VREIIKSVPGWTWKRNGANKIEKEYAFKDFKEAMVFVNKAADVAEEQDHHPDMFIHWNKVTILMGY
jgi:4a-hydroxytetrahydrobiopterin dehydratase